MAYFGYGVFVFALIVLFSSFVTVKQGTIAVVTIFGKYQRLLRPGLNFKIPLIEVIHSRISIQNRSVELSFQAGNNKIRPMFISRPCCFTPY